MPLNYSFFSDQGETPATLAERRWKANQLAGQIGQGNTYGSGIGDLFRGLGVGLSRYRTNKMQKEGDAGARKMRDALPPEVWTGIKPIRPTASNDDVKRTVLTKLAGMGYSPAQIAGIAGNLQQESGFNPTIEGDNGASFGIAQWQGPRRVALQQFAAERGADVNDPELQAEFLNHELQTTESGAGEALRAAQTPEEATNAFLGFERPQGYTADNPAGAHGYGNRQANAAAMVPELATYTPPQPQPAGGPAAPQMPVQPQAPVDHAQSMAPAQQAAAAQMQPAGNDAALIPQILEYLNNPYTSDQDKVFLQQRLEDIQKKQDPAYQTDLQLKQLQLQQARDPSSIPLSRAEQARIDFDKEKFDYEKAKGDPAWSKLSDNSLFNQITGEVKPVPGAAPPTADFKDVNILRKEVQDTIPIKNYQQAAPIYRSMVETAPRNTKASDMNMVFGLGKIVDPTSVVRDGDRIAAQNTAALPDFLIGAINTLNGGAMLQPETRAAIMAEAKTRMDSYAAEANALKGHYVGIAERHNINIDDIWQPLDKLPDYTPKVKTEINGYTIEEE